MKRARLTNYCLPLGLALLLGSCGGNSGSGSESALASLPADSAGPSVEQLSQKLDDWFSEQGIDATRTGSSVPEAPAAAVFDLQASIGDAAEPGSRSVTLDWTSRLPGDTDQNGSVNLSDLTPLSVYFGSQVTYRPAEEAGGLTYWPAGEPDQAGAENWRLAAVDADGNGLVGLSDVSVIGQYWQQGIEGYAVFVQSGNAQTATRLPNPTDPDLPYTLSLPAALPGAPLRLSFSFSLPEDDSYTLSVRPIFEGTEGVASNAVALTLMAEGVPPVVQLSYDAPSGRLLAGGSYDPDGEIVSYLWDITGNGDYNTPTNQYNASAPVDFRKLAIGDFEAGVRVTDNDGLVTEQRLQFFIDPPNHKPVLEFSHELSGETAPVIFTVDMSGSYDPDGTALEYSVSFGELDGSYGLDAGFSENAVRHFSLQYGGSYEVKVSVRSAEPDALYSDPRRFSIELDGPNIEPLAALHAEQSFTLAGEGINFNTSGCQDPAGFISSFEFDLEGDGIYDISGGGTPPNPLHVTYPLAGSFTPTLRVIDSDGAFSTASTAVTVYASAADVPAHLDLQPVFSLNMAEPVYYQGLFARPGGNMVFVHSKGQADEYDNSGTLQQSVDASYEVMNQGNFIAWLDTYMDLAGNLYIYGSQSGGGSRLISYDPDFALRFDEPDLQFYRLDVSRSGQIAYKSWDRGVVLCDSMFAEIAAFPELTEPNSNVVFDDKSLLYAGNAGQTYMISKAGKLQKILNGSFVRDDSAAAPGYMIVENGSYNLYQSGELQYVLDESLRTVQIQRFLLDNAPFSSPRPQFSAPAAGLLSAFAGERNLFARLGPSGEIILVRDGVITGYEIDGTVRWRIDPDMDVFEITVDPEQGRLLVALGPLGIDAVRAYELP